MRVSVDEEKCQGHARCAEVAASVFDLDEHGRGHVIAEGEVPPGSEAAALRAQRNCPERAVIVRDQP